MAELGPSPSQRDQTRRALLSLLACEKSSWMPRRLADATMQFAVTAEDQDQIRQTLLKQLDSKNDSSLAAALADALCNLDPTPGQQDQARAALVALLASETLLWNPEAPIRVLAKLAPTVADLARSYLWDVAPTAGLLAAIRQHSMLSEWLTILPSLSDPDE